MHIAAHAFVRSFVEFSGITARPIPPIVVEVGSRNINGTIRDLFRGCTFIGTDIRAGIGVDVVADGATYRPPLPADVAICCEVLEHAENAKHIVRNLWAIVKPGGYIVITCAAPERKPHSAIDGCDLKPGEYYCGVTPEEIRDWLAPANPAASTLQHDHVLGDSYFWALKPR
jgi:SAM-dependent methyltransferase